MGATTLEIARPRPSTRDAARAIGWWVLVGAASGAIAGFVFGGIGGRLAMLLLRLTSPDAVVGMISDDGFEIGIVTTKSFTFALQMTMLGGFNGVLYAVARKAIPARFRLVLWTAFAALVGGASFVHDDGVDFTLIEPALLAILLFVALPAAGAALVVVLVERWSKAEPWQSRRLSAGLGVAALASTFAVVFALVVAVVALAVSQSPPLGRFLLAAGRIVVPIVLVALAALAAIDLVSESSRILD
jgi:hypothetical protein